MLDKHPEGGHDSSSIQLPQIKSVQNKSTAGNSVKRFHVHFGAGRLGMSLVVPAIAASGIPFAVVQRPTKEWEEQFGAGSNITIDFKVCCASI